MFKFAPGGPKSGDAVSVYRGAASACLADPSRMLLQLFRVSFWLAALAAAWALVAPGRHETALTVVAGGGALIALVLWRCAVSANRRSYAGDADVPASAVLTSASLDDAAAAIARIADEAATEEAALRAVAAVLKTELGARAARLHDVLEVAATHAQLAEWLPEATSNGAGLHAPARRVALAGSALGEAIATRCDAIALPHAIVVPLADAGADATPRIVLIELEELEMAIDPTALASLLQLTRRSHRAVTRRLAAAPAPMVSTAADTHIRVLVIEDKVVQTETTARMLERLGCCTTMASGMLEAVHALRATQFDLVLMDMHMPAVGTADHAARGLDWLRDRRGWAPAAMHSTPTVVALAEHGVHADVERFRGLGFDDCLFKPFRRQQLQALLDKHVRRRAPMSDVGGAGALPPSASADVLDPTALARLRELDPNGENQLVQRVLKAFQTSAARLLPQLQAARGANDRNTVRLVAHTLKSSSASIGAMRLSQICAELEATIRTDDSADIEPGIALMTTTLDAALQAIRHELEATR
jgi:CheY-like chemotaxis protein/HPt (histidine-containing phosphotransfer) domain-containing protein